MKSDNHQSIAYKIKNSPAPFAVLLILMVGLSLWLAGPLLVPLIWSAIFAYFVRPVYERLHMKTFGGRYRNVAAAFAAFLVLVFIALPIVGISLSALGEVLRLYKVMAFYLSHLDQVGVDALRGLLENRWKEYLDPVITGSPHFQNLLAEAGRVATRLLASVSGATLEIGASLIYGIIIIAITCFFFIRDGDRIVAFAMNLLPMPPQGKAGVLKRAKKMLSSVVFGIVLTAAVQGLLGALGWWFVELSHPALFGFIMFFTAMIPFVGTPVVWVPGAVYLIYTGDYKMAAALLVWGVGVVSMVDNFIRPFFISEGSSVPMLIVLIGVFGGLATWGFLGIFVGPLVLSLTVFLLDLYGSIVSGNPWQTDDEDVPPENTVS